MNQAFRNIANMLQDTHDGLLELRREPNRALCTGRAIRRPRRDTELGRKLTDMVMASRA